MRDGWKSRVCAKLFCRVWFGTLGIFMVLCIYVGVLELLGHEAAARQVDDIALMVATGGIGAFVGVMLCEDERRHRSKR